MAHAHTEQRSGARRAPGGYLLASGIVLAVTVLLIGGFCALLLRPTVDLGFRVWMLNHTPDQCLIINPFDGVVEKKFSVADGLRELAFSADYSTAYVANVVDISNRLTVLDTSTYLDKDTIEVDGVPQGLAAFPDGRLLAVILGSKTDFMAGGFDVLDLQQRSKADPKQKKRLYRERDLNLTHKIAVGDDGNRIYCIDAKDSKIFIFSLKEKRKVGEVELHGAAEELLYPRAGRYYFVSVLNHQAIYQIDKLTDQVVGAYIYAVRNPALMFNFNRLRYMAVDSEGRYLYGTNFEAKTVAVWEIGNPAHKLSWQQLPVITNDEGYYIFQVDYFLPLLRFKLKGGYKPGKTYIPGGQQLALDEGNQYLFVVDEDGALYIYDNRPLFELKDLATPEPRVIVSSIEGEMRDLKISRPSVRRGSH
jgi:hypothetical protein